MFAALMSTFVLALSGPADRPDMPTADNPVVTLQGDPDAEIVVRENNGETLYSAGIVATETKLPEGYPRPTPPGMVELKYYPSVRRAEFTSSSPVDNAGRVGFMPLFRHISSRGIAMTSPVEMDYGENNWTMSFLYETVEDGPAGNDGSVEVIDTDPITVLAMGVEGSRGFEALEERAEALRSWIAENPNIEIAGETRSLGYNGPYIPVSRRWWEVQIPVRLVEDQSNTASDATAPNATTPEGEI